MKVELKCTVKYLGKYHAPATVLDIEDVIALSLIETNMAVPLTDRAQDIKVASKERETLSSDSTIEDLLDQAEDDDLSGSKVVGDVEDGAGECLPPASVASHKISLTKVNKSKTKK